MDKEIIVVKQLPIIVEQLQQISQQINDKVHAVLSLACTEDTYKDIKRLRSQLKKDFNELEDKRKEVKKAILIPYEEFENVYKDCVTNVFKPADEILAERISAIEDGLKEEKRKDVQAYFDEYAQSKGIDFITLNDVGLNISLSASKKSLKEKVKSFVDKVSDDLTMIETKENNTEILVEYKKSLNVSQAIIVVNNRHKLIEAERQRAERLRKSQEEKNNASAAVDKVIEESELENIHGPQKMELPTEETSVTVPDKKYVATFKVTAYDIQVLKDLVNFMKKRGINYEQL